MRHTIGDARSTLRSRLTKDSLDDENVEDLLCCPEHTDNLFGLANSGASCPHATPFNNASTEIPRAIFEGPYVRKLSSI